MKMVAFHYGCHLRSSPSIAHNQSDAEKIRSAMGAKFVTQNATVIDGRSWSGGESRVLLGLDQKIMQTLNHDGSNGEPSVQSSSGPLRAVPSEDSQAASNIGAMRYRGK
jgi:hypothetical protein